MQQVLWSVPPASYTFNGTTWDVVTTSMWTMLSDLFDFCNLDSDNGNPTRKNGNHYSQRRAWFYSGGGLPLNDDGTLNDATGLMRSRFVGPATPGVYKTSILDHWTGHDGRFRCFFLDAASRFYGKFVELVHHDDINSNFVLVGEAIPTDEDARNGAPWVSLVEFAKAPWWNPVDGVPNKQQGGYNPSWSSRWLDRPTYFIVKRGDAPDLYNINGSGDGPGPGSNLKMGDIYKWCLKGAIPVAEAEVWDKVGAAWNYATGRVMPSRLIRCPRLIRSIRC